MLLEFASSRGACVRAAREQRRLDWSRLRTELVSF
jgi:hypothetical protein